MKNIVYIIIGLVLFCGCSNNSFDCEVAQNKIDNGALLVDVRTKEEYNTYHLENAISVPLDNIDNISDIISDNNLEIIVYCQSGNRSKQAFNKLKDMGYDNVYDLGGINTCIDE